MKNVIQFKNLNDIDKQLKDERTCRAYYESIRFCEGVFCPHCKSTKYYTLKPSKNQNEYKCANKECRKKFNCLTGTIFENTKISIIVWFKAIYLCSTLSKGISSPNLAIALGITQKSAWFLLHCVREMLKVKAPTLLEGEVEVDETWVGGKSEFKHANKRIGIQGTTSDKVPVIGLVQRGGNMVVAPIKDARIDTIRPIMVSNIKRKSTVYTDKASVYKSLGKLDFQHDSVDHVRGEYVRGGVHTNTIEGAFGLFKRKINGIHHQVSPKHLHRYCVEFSFGHNNKGISPYEKFNIALQRCDTRLLYKVLIR